MNRKSAGLNGLVVSLLIAAILSSGMPVPAQDLVAMNDISGGSSVFVFKSSAKAAPRRFTPNAGRATRTKAQRLEVAVRVKKQYEVKAASDPGRIKVVAPTELGKSPSMAKGEASKLFTGVGQYYIDRGQFDNAIENFKDALDLDAKNQAAQIGMSDALARQGNDLLVKDQDRAARGKFQQALTYNPKNAAAYFGLGTVASDSDQNKDAIVNYEKALEYDKNLTEIYAPLGIAYYETGEIAKADDMLSKSLTNSEGTADTQYFLGLIRFSQNRNDEALAALQKSAKLDATNADVFYKIGETYDRQSKTKEAMAAYEQAVALKANYPDAYLALGGMYFEASNYPKAIENYKNAAKYRNDNGEIYAALADSYRLNNNWNEAEANYNLAELFMLRKPNYNKAELSDIYNKISYVIVQQCYINKTQNLACKYPAAQTALEKAIALTGDQSDYANLGWINLLVAADEKRYGHKEASAAAFEKARIALERAKAGNPKVTDAVLANLGIVQVEQGNFKGAIESLVPVVPHQPNWPFVPYTLGTAYFKVDDFANAAKYLRTASEADPDNVSYLRSLAYAEIKNKNGKEVKKVIDRLKKLSPGDATQIEQSAKLAKVV